MSTEVIPSFQMREPRQREVKELVQWLAVGGKTNKQDRVVWLKNPHS